MANRDYDREILGAEQQLKVARALREGNKTPEGQMVSGWYVPPSITQGVAQLYNSYLYGKQEKEALSKQKEISEAKQQELADLLRGYGKKDQVQVSPQMASGETTQMPQGSLVDAAMQGQVAQPAPNMTQTQQVPLNPQEQMAQDIRLNQLDPLAGAMVDRRAAREDAQAAKIEQMRLAAELKNAMIKNGGGDKSYYQPLQTANGVFAFNARTGNVEQVQGMGGSPVVGAQYDPALQGRISNAKAAGSETGKASGEAAAKLQDIQSQMPQLDKLVAELGELGNKATYTQAGQLIDASKRQAGMDVGEGALARKEYISRVDNEILPLLRQTFGAAFTEKEGAALRATLGDPNAHPKEKNRVLKSFIQTKRQEIESLQRRTGQAPATSGAKFLGFENANS